MFVGEVTRYLIAGVVNTVAGYCTFLLLLHIWCFNPWYANAGSYAVGLMIAYMLNLTFVFRNSSHSSRGVMRFLAAFVFSYGLNLGVLHIMLDHLHFGAEFAQFAAMASYTVSFYCFNKFFVWSGWGVERHASNGNEG